MIFPYSSHYAELISEAYSPLSHHPPLQIQSHHHSHPKNKEWLIKMFLKIAKLLKRKQKVPTG
jgi:hypothetical protein